MSEFIEKNIKSAKVLCISILIQIVVSFACFCAVPYIESGIFYLFLMILPFSAILCGLIYLGAYSPFLSNIKWLKKKGYENIANDIDINNPTLPRSKIHCGQRAFFSKKPKAIIPYNEIAWIYVKKTNINGIEAENHTIIYMNDGKKFEITAHRCEEEFKWLLANYIIRNSPNVILGYGFEQKARYKEIRKNARKKS